MSELKWWQSAVFYQIYPRSFADSNGDGIGDLPGIISHLDYVQDLGVEAIWLSPHYPSPQFDVGYDIADYTGVEPDYGTLDDFKRLLDGLHQRGMRLILDLVLNHTSDQHPWFIESRSSCENPKRDWYIWRDGKKGGPPNNWVSPFSGSAWEYDPTTGQYYYHFFFKEQPDLNWRNPEVKEAMFAAVRFWLDLGVDGFRLDAIDTIFEDPDFPDHTAELSLLELYQRYEAAKTEEERAYLEEQREKMMAPQLLQPGIHELFQEFRALVDAYEDRVLVGETDDISYYGAGNDELHLAFNFPLMRAERLTPAHIRANQKERLAALPAGAWPCNTLGNHDTPRVYSRYGDGENDEALARLSLALMLTLWGTPFLYNGEEIGMTNLILENIDQFRDNMSLFAYRAMVEAGLLEDQALAEAARFTRDQCRSPMQWANAPNAGFSPAGVETWLPLNPNYAQGVNVADQDKDPDSLLNFYRRMLRLRKQTPTLIAGDYKPLHEEAEAYLAFLRQTDEQTWLVVLNFSNEAHPLAFELEAKTVKCIFSSQIRGANSDSLSKLTIAPLEIYIAELV